MELIQIDGTTVQMALPIEVITENVTQARQLGLPMLHEGPDWREPMTLSAVFDGDSCQAMSNTPDLRFGSIALVGGGHSLTTQLVQLRDFPSIMLCGSVHDYARRAGIKARWCVCVDPDPIMANYLTLPDMDCTYLIASQCHPSVFERLYGCKVLLWHAGGPSSAANIFGERQIMLGGGCTVGMRAMTIARTFGYRDMHLFGFDTCITKGEHHAYEFTDPSETVGNLRSIRFSPNGREFLMADYHIAQMFDFKQFLEHNGDEVCVTVHGDGALAELFAEGRKIRDAA